MKRLLHSKDLTLEIKKGIFGNWSSVFSSPIYNKLAKKEENYRKVIYIETKEDDGKRVPINQGKLEFPEMKLELRKRGKEESFVFPVFDSVVDEKVRILGFPSVVDRALIVDTDRKRLYLGEYSRVNETDLVLSIECVVVEGLRNGKVVELIFPCGNVDSKKIMEDLKKDFVIFSGMRVPSLKPSKNSFDISEMFFVNVYGAYIDLYEDVKKTICKIKDFEVLCPYLNAQTGMPIYSRELNRLILFAVFYLKMGDPVFDLIVYGAGGSGKSTCIIMHGLIYSDSGNYICGPDTTTAGLVKSYGEGVRPGLLISPVDYVKAVDELFRRSSSDASMKGKRDPALEVTALLERLMSLVLRDVKGRSGSGKGNSRQEDYMRDSFIASDNMKPEVKMAFCSLVRDGGLFRRFSFVKIRKNDKLEVQKAKIRPSHDELFDYVLERFAKNNLSHNEVKRFSKWFRRVSEKVSVNGERTYEVCEEVQKEMLRRTWNRLYAGQTNVGDEDRFNSFVDNWVSEQNIIPLYEALVRCCAVERAVIDHGDENSFPVVHVSEEDYVAAEKLFRRLCEDTFEIYEEGIIKWIRDVNERSLERTFVNGFKKAY